MVRANFDSKTQKDILPDITNMLFGGGGSASLLGLKNYGSTEANLAHRNEAEKHMRNIMEGGGDKVMMTCIKGADGNPITQPYLDGDGEVVFPNKDGDVRAINGGFLSMMKEIHDNLENKIDQAMEFCIIDDEMARFVMGINKDDWKKYTNKMSKAESEALGMSEELGDIQCDITYIKSLPSGSISQTQSLSKLRHLVRIHIKNINIKGLVSLNTMKKDGEEGKLLPYDAKTPAQTHNDLQVQGVQ